MPIAPKPEPLIDQIHRNARAQGASPKIQAALIRAQAVLVAAEIAATALRDAAKINADALDNFTKAFANKRFF